MSDVKKNEPLLSFQTEMIHGEFNTEAWDFTKPLIPPISASTTFRLGSVERGAEGFLSFGSENFSKKPIWVYDRLDEPNTLMLESQLAKAEGGDIAVSFGSGMGAIASCFLAFCKANDEVITHRTIYGCTYSLIKNWLPRLGIKTHFADLNQNWEELVTEKTRIIYFESVSNPNLEIIDIQNLVKQVKKLNSQRSEENKILVMVDNTFATPCGCQPLRQGADIVAHSLTKNISGFGTEMGGVAITRKHFETKLKMARKDFGAVMHPHAAWDINTHGVPTLSLRYHKQQEGAKRVAQFLNEHSKIEYVNYPGLETFKHYKIAKETLINREGEFNPGYMIAFELKDSEKTTVNFVNKLAQDSYSITLAVSLGLTKTLIELPNYMTHSVIEEQDKKDFAVAPLLVRMSIGLEDPKDIINDLKMALAHV